MKVKHYKRRCAVCGDTCQEHVRRKWYRLADNRTFYVCLACEESGKVNRTTVKPAASGGYTTYELKYEYAIPGIVG